MKADDVHSMSNDELKVETGRLRRQLYDLRCQAATEKLENPRQIPHIRRDIARLLTECGQRGIKEQV